jgi:hypothetical protein
MTVSVAAPFGDVERAEASRVIERGLAADGRIYRFDVLLNDHVLCTVETRDRADIAEIQKRLAENGVELFNGKFDFDNVFFPDVKLLK